MPSSEHSARFSPGQVVVHRKFGYRGVIADVDSEYSGTEAWYEQVARSMPPKDAPWYHVLVHDASHTTYVAERHLMADPSSQPIHHPLLEDLFEPSGSGGYRRRRSIN